MNKNDISSWTICLDCQGQGKTKQRISKKAKLRYQLELDQFEKSNVKKNVPVLPKSHLKTCLNCSGSGLLQSSSFPIPDNENYPHVSIIGGGIGGVALAVACLHRKIPFTLYERDSDFNVRSQGYGLTLQQASKAIEALGLFSLEEGVVSTRHVVHTTQGKVIGEWGIRKWLQSTTKASPRRTNIHIARQSLRLALLQQLGEKETVQWGHQLIDIHENEGEKVVLSFLVNGTVKTAMTDLVVGADGIRSAVRNLKMGENSSPLHYLDCIVILGICPLSALDDISNPLLDSKTVFQTANGKERIYIMPYSSNAVMWQLSFPMSENDAKKLSTLGSQALKEEAARRTQWHEPIPQIIAATQEIQISGYPVYDREILSLEELKKNDKITLIGDAAHPMSPFKGQGANQALLDALALARGIFKGCNPKSKWREKGIRESVLNEFELEMLERSSVKVNDSKKAVHILHSEIVLHEANAPRGRVL